MGQTTVLIPGIIEASTIYAGGTLVARNEKISVPEVKRATFTQKLAGGEQDFPSIALEDMETSVSKNGLNENALTFINEKKIEVRWVQTETASDGTINRIGFKLFMDTLPVTMLPGADIDVGSGIETDIVKKVTSISLYKNGKEIVNINKITGAQVINGKNYGIDDTML